MKTILRSVLVLAGMAMISTSTLQSQTMTGTILAQPCNNNGQIGVTVTGITPPINYTLINSTSGQMVVHSGMPSTSDVFTLLPGYFYQLWQNPNTWVIAASNGVNTASMNFTLTPAFNATLQVTPATCPALSTVQAVGFVGGTAPYVCVWTNTTSTLSYTANPAQLPNGSYSLVATDFAGCKVQTTPGFTYNVNVWSNPTFSVNMAGTTANCTNGTASVTAIPGAGVSPYTYLWNNSAVSSAISGLTMGQYNCTVTDALGCQSTGYYYVSQAVTINFNTSVTHATCLQNNGSILGFVSGGTGPYTYFWSNGATTPNLTGLTGGQYLCQITDANGCIGSNWSYVNVTTPINVITNVSASSCTVSTGAATVTPSGGQAPYSYLWYTFPSNSTGSTISGRPVGNYSFKVTDANGCVRTGVAVIQPISSISVVFSSPGVMCPATTGNLTALVSGSSPPFTYLWSNSATTNVITGVPLGYYSCVITDAVGCSVTKGDNLLQYSPVTLGYSTSPSSCIFSANGSAMANATGGTAPYTYAWSNSQTGPNATGLVTGNYWAIATDANGCTNSSSGYAFVGYNAANNSCYCTITGTVYNDGNLNCIRNPGENGITRIPIHCTGYGYEYTNTPGVYSFKVPSGTYTLSQAVQPFYPLAGCQGNSSVVTVVAGPGCQSIVNFANTITPTNDLRVYISNMNSPRPGNTCQQMVIVENDGTNTQSTIQFRYKHDGQLSYLNSNPWAMIQQNVGAPTWYSMLSGIASLTAGAITVDYINYNVPTNIPISTQVVFYDTVARLAPVGTNWLSDATPWNNVNYHTAMVVGSFDPNFKEVTPQGSGPQGTITKNDSILTYVVHFQNTGSDYAQDIVVLDTLDTDLNIGSLHPGYSDHSYSVSISENRVAKFTFNNINLLWKSAYGDAASSGMFSYSIRLKKNLAIGTQIKNSAAIYFDYNKPVITNVTLNTIGQSTVTTSVAELKKEGVSKMVLYPNPASNYFDLLYESKENVSGQMIIYDLSGRGISDTKVELSAGTNTLRSSTSQLQNGIYLVQLKTENATLVGKLIVTR